MKRNWIQYQDTAPSTPMTYWVHDEELGDDGISGFNPPKQEPIPGKGYPLFHVECDGFTFIFASPAEIRECIKVLNEKILPQTIGKPVPGSSTPPGWANSHWLSRLPAKVKSWKYRQKAVVYLREAMTAFEREMA